MKVKMKMPDLSANEEEIEVVRWLVAPGDAIARGQPLLEVQTDKAVMEVEAIATGILAETCAEPTAKIQVGQVIAVIEVKETA